MSLTGQIGRNTIIQFVGKIIGTALGFATVVYMLRYLAPAEYGYYTTVISYLGFFGVIAELGLYLTLIREISKPGADTSRAIGNVMGLRIVAGTVLLGLGLAIAWFLPYPPVVKQGMLIGVVSFVAIILNQLLVGIFQKKLAMHWVVIGEVAGRVLLFFGTLFVIRLDLGLLAIIAVVVLGSVLNFLITFVAAQKYERITLQFDWPYWGYLLRETAPLAISVVLNLLYFRLDTIFLSLMKSPADVGLYGASYKILEILVTFPNMFVGLLLPILTATAFVNRDRFITVFQRAFDFLLMATIPLVIGGLLIAKPLILFFNSDYAGAVPIFRVLIFAIGFLFLGALSGHTIVAINAQRRMVWGYLTVALLGVVSYLVLIPPFSVYGAAVGTVLTELTIMLIGFIIILRTMSFRLSFRYGLIAIAASLPMAGALWLARDLNLFIQIGIGTIVYLIALYLFRGFDRSFLRELLSNRTTPSTDAEFPSV
jgi:O-antigen/teichoic acid export membrane protein